MKIMSEPPRHTRLAPEATPRAAILERSFSDYIDRAHDRPSDRAASFSEVGILGRQYREAPNNITPAGLRHERVPTSYPELTESRHINTDRTMPGGNARVTLTTSSQAHVPTALSITSSSDGPHSPQIANSSGVEPNPPAKLQHNAKLKPLLAYYFEKACNKHQPNVRFALTVQETRDGISIIFDSEDLTETISKEISGLASRIAKDFGVTVRSLVVNGDLS
jgi:hypothetical protein